MNNNSDMAKVIEMIERVPYCPPGFVIKEEGVFFIDKKYQEEFCICDPLHIEALARDENGNSWGCLLVWRDPDGRKHEWAMPNSMLASDGAEYRRILLEKGLRIRGGRKAQNGLHNYIMAAAPSARAFSVRIPGWHKNQYMAVDGTVYGQGRDKILLQAAGNLPSLTNKGSLESWQRNVADYALGNSRLIFAISASLAGPLLYFANEGSGGFHFSGESSGGKTTALRVASSVWGLPLRSWRTTDNAAESWARNANDSFLAIDELGQVDGRAADQMAYMLGNGQTKGRANKDGMAKDTTEFRLMFLSTGEIGLAEKLGEGKKKAKAGQAVRMIEVPADAGQSMRMFENIHNFSSPDEFAKHLRIVTEDNQGCIAPIWLERLTELEESLSATIAMLSTDWLKENVADNSDGQVLRAARRFALVAVAGELASSLGILPWPDKTASTAAARCFQDWLCLRGGVGSHESKEGISTILNFISLHGQSRFQNMAGDIENNSEKTHNRAGWRRKNDKGEDEYLIQRDVLKSEILGSAYNIDGIVKAAIECGLIIPGTEKTTRPVELPGLGKKRVLSIIPSRYTGDET